MNSVSLVNSNYSSQQILNRKNPAFNAKIKLDPEILRYLEEKIRKVYGSSRESHVIEMVQDGVDAQGNKRLVPVKKKMDIYV